VDVQVDRIGGLVERRVDEGVLAHRNPANHDSNTHELNPCLWVCLTEEGCLIPYGIFCVALFSTTPTGALFSHIPPLWHMEISIKK
jgi:hypothetical protein